MISTWNTPFCLDILVSQEYSFWSCIFISMNEWKKYFDKIFIGLLRCSHVFRRENSEFFLNFWIDHIVWTKKLITNKQRTLWFVKKCKKYDILSSWKYVASSSNPMRVWNYKNSKDISWKYFWCIRKKIITLWFNIACRQTICTKKNIVIQEK